MFGFSLAKFGVIAGFLGAGRQKGGELFTTRPVRHKSHGINLELGKWTWIAFMSDKSGSVFYQNGKEVNRDGPFVFHKALPVKFTCIFCGHYGDLDKPGEGRARSFNGSFAVVRIYDKVLSANEIMANHSLHCSCCCTCLKTHNNLGHGESKVLTWLAVLRLPVSFHRYSRSRKR